MKRTFLGYKRPDQTWGVRNHVAIISTADNSNFVARRAAALIRGTIPLCPCFGRGEIGKDMELHIRVMAGLGSNPNVHSVILVSLERVIAEKIARIIRESGKEVKIFTMDEDGGSVGCTEKAAREARRMVICASQEHREETSLEHLMLGVECGGSDTTSGIVSNPAVGLVADRLERDNGTVVLSETTEWMGAENFLVPRCKKKETRKKIEKAVGWYEDYIKSIGVDLNGFNPAPDNIRGGLSTIEEKALGSVKKGGSGPIQDMISCGERPPGKGLYLMDAPTGGVENTTALAAAGCQLILFSTGKGNPLGNPVAPTIKVTGNGRTAMRFLENIDVDLSGVLKGDLTLSEAGSILFSEMCSFAEGKLTTAEVLGDEEIAVTRIGFTV
ncbi:MAG TPA: UxaA family hydrolase [Candidatus Limivivens intestinipullorum]|uniref:UxaA family hydrolase n=1 Tax=Candidatus Limivivens intestinipullorum TaxID=2840858 RepID=A0A9D1EQJ5_9FIRM|nr:UxaA family hydrolase [Candidatus Limivivens intestinipullorum]